MTPLDQLIQAVLSSPKYKTVCPDLVEHLGQQELAKRRSLKEAVKAVKNKLHQIGGAYLAEKMLYAAWLDELQVAQSPHPVAGATPLSHWERGKDEGFLPPAAHEIGPLSNLRPVCARILSHHASTRERLPILDQFYTTLLAGLPPIHTVLDLACGLNPLTTPWLPQLANIEYYAYDIYQDMMDFLNGFFAIAGVNSRAEAADIIHACPTRPADLVLLLKTIPCLEQVDKSAGARLLDSLNAPHLLVSFPAHSLGGRSKGMTAHYAAHFEALAAGKHWQIQRFEFPGELVFRVSR